MKQIITQEKSLFNKSQYAITDIFHKLFAMFILTHNVISYTMEKRDLLNQF